MAHPTPPGFDFKQPPFDLLTADAQAALARQLDMVLFRQGEILIEAATASDHVYVILKGDVIASDIHSGSEVLFGDYQNGDLLGAFAVIAGRARHRYRATQDTLCFAIPAPHFKQLIGSQPSFAAYFLESMAVKKRLLKERDQPSDLAEVMLGRICDGMVMAPLILPPESSIQAAVRAMRDARLDNVLVTLGETHGIVTRTDLLEAVALNNVLPSSAIGALARTPLIAADENTLLFEALVTMTTRRIHRIVVTREGGVIGTLGMMEVLSHFSAKSHLINFRVEQATSTKDLQTIAHELNGLVRTLFAQGAKIRFLMDLISALNTRLLARVAELLPGMPAGSTLLVLGSEGRHEQILKTDQDNALILPEDCADPTEFAFEFSQQLEAMGFPPCPGGVMVRNPVWRRSESAWIQTVRGWIQTPDDEAVMHLAMLLDASAVSGPEAPVTAIRESIFALASNPGAMQRFAAPAIRFRTPLTLFGGLRGGAAGLDIKKGGVFPLVHGVRALALQHRVTATNTFARIAALSDIGAIHATNARDIAQALSALLRLRLAAQIAAMSRGETPNNVIQPSQLRRLDVELLRDALRVVREFQDWLRREFHLD